MLLSLLGPIFRHVDLVLGQQQLLTSSLSFLQQIRVICSFMRNSTFSLCHVVLDPLPYIKMCEKELCSCSLSNRIDCACSAFTQYSRACARHSAPVRWRSRHTCRKWKIIEVYLYNSLFSQITV